MKDLTIESVLEGLGLNCARQFTGLQMPQRVVPLTDAELAAKVAELEKSDD